MQRESRSLEALAGFQVSARYVRAGDEIERVMTVGAD